MNSKILNYSIHLRLLFEKKEGILRQKLINVKNGMYKKIILL